MLIKVDWYSDTLLPILGISDLDKYLQIAYFNYLLIPLYYKQKIIF